MCLRESIWTLLVKIGRLYRFVFGFDTEIRFVRTKPISRFDHKCGSQPWHPGPGFEPGTSRGCPEIWSWSRGCPSRVPPGKSGKFCGCPGGYGSGPGGARSERLDPGGAQTHQDAMYNNQHLLENLSRAQKHVLGVFNPTAQGYRLEFGCPDRGRKHAPKCKTSL